MAAGAAAVFWMIVLTAVFPEKGAPEAVSVSIKCEDIACVQEVEEHALQEPAIIRFRLWNPGNYSNLHMLRSFVWPPDREWNKS